MTRRLNSPDFDTARAVRLLTTTARALRAVLSAAPANRQRTLKATIRLREAHARELARLSKHDGLVAAAKRYATQWTLRRHRVSKTVNGAQQMAVEAVDQADKVLLIALDRLARKTDQAHVREAVNRQISWLKVQRHLLDGLRIHPMKAA